MKNLKRIISVILCTAVVTGILSGCSKKVDEEGYVARTRQEASEQSQAEAQNNSELSQTAESTADWTTMSVTIGEDAIKFDKMPYKTLEDLGWSFDPVIYGMDKLSAEKGVFYQRSVYLENDNYDDACVCVGFTNFEEEPCGLDKVSVWSIEFVSNGKSKFPAVTLPGGITWGSNEEKVRAVYGQPTIIERSDAESFTRFTYSFDNKKIILDIYDSMGIGRMVLETV